MTRDAAILSTGFRYFVAVADAGSIRAAADELNIAASAVSRQVLQLEEALGIDLFERVGRGLRLSEAGSLLRSHLRGTVSDYQDLIAELDALRGLRRGRVRLATVESVSVDLLPALLVDFWEHLPGIEVVVTVAGSDDVTRLVRARDADLGFTFNPQSLDGLDVPFAQDFRIGALVATNHPLAGRATLTLADCLDYPIALPSRGLSLRAALDPALAVHAPGLRPRVEANSLRTMAALARNDGCIAFQTPIGIERERAEGGLVLRPLDDPEILDDRFVVIQEGHRKPSTAVSAFIEFVVAELPERL